MIVTGTINTLYAVEYSDNRKDWDVVGIFKNKEAAIRKYNAYLEEMLHTKVLVRVAFFVRHPEPIALISLGQK